jgi:hypothetical protein
MAGLHRCLLVGRLRPSACPRPWCSSGGRGSGAALEAQTLEKGVGAGKVCGAREGGDGRGGGRSSGALAFRRSEIRGDVAQLESPQQDGGAAVAQRLGGV